MTMKSVVLDKIASVTRNCRVARQARMGSEFPCREGDVVAVQVRTRKSCYDQLELTTGRFSKLNPGDVVAGVLGHRRALGGYAGHVPERLEVGDRIDILNLGGVLGICDAIHPDLGPPLSCEVLGQVLHFPYLGERIGVPATITEGALPLDEKLDVAGVPVVAVVGTGMNSGKSAAAHALVQGFVHRGLRVHGGKATGVSLRRDVLGMEDAGATRTLTFTDLGIVTTTRDTAPLVARSLLTALSRERPDVIVLELGDGLLGEYGVDAILADAELRAAFSVIVFTASDPVGACGGVELLRAQYGLDVAVVCGPTTDNSVGSAVIRERLGVAAHNARVEPAELAATVLDSIARRQEQGS